MYIKLFNDINYHIKIYNINVNFKNINIAIKEVFTLSKINGCFFHYVKALWKKIKVYGLTSKNFIETSKIIVFSFKITLLLVIIIKKNILKIYLNLLKMQIVDMKNSSKIVIVLG